MAKKVGFRFYFDKDYEYILEEEMRYHSAHFAKITARYRFYMYTCLFNRDMRKKLIKKDSMCKYCGDNNKLQIDHIIPRSKGGKNIESNLQILCAKCNQKKSNK